MKHVDDWIEESAMGNDENAKYAAFFLHLKRLPASLQMGFESQIKNFKLFCNYAGEKYRVTGASRMGDVWLTRNFEQDQGYEERVDIELCSGWSKQF